VTDGQGSAPSMPTTTATVSAAAIRSQAANGRCSPATPGLGDQVHARAEDAGRCHGLQGDRQVGGARGNHRDQAGGSGSGPATRVLPRSSITAPGSDSRQAGRQGAQARGGWRGRRGLGGRRKAGARWTRVRWRSCRCRTPPPGRRSARSSHVHPGRSRAQPTRRSPASDDLAGKRSRL
jgi:hypothetical protein